MDRELGILGWSQAELARKLGVKPSTVTTWRRRGLPRTVAKYLEAMVALHEVRELAGGHVARTPRAKRRPSGEVWQRSAADVGIQTPNGDYRRRIERAEESDMDQDSEEWGRG